MWKWPSDFVDGWNGDASNKTTITIMVLGSILNDDTNTGDFSITVTATVGD